MNYGNKPHHDAPDTFTKRVREPDQAGAEAAGLRWLGENTHAVVEVVRVDGLELVTERIHEVMPTEWAAQEAGRQIRVMHESGAEAFGCPPAGWAGKNYIGRVEQRCEPTDNWARFYVEQRVLPFARNANLRPQQLDLVERACAAIVANDGGKYGRVAPARIHGDLWAGNLLFSSDGPVMIDPAAHGGHPFTDLAMLALFGAPYLSRIVAGYGAPDDFFDWVPMHQLHPLAVHAMTHGPGYHADLARAAETTLKVLGES